MLYRKMDGQVAQAEIAALVATPVATVEAGEDEEEEDDRPLWQRRLDEENANSGYDRFGPPGESSIP